MKLLTTLLTSLAIATTSVNASSLSNESVRVKSSQCMIGTMYFDCSLRSEIVGMEAHMQIKFADNKAGWDVIRTWDDANSRATQIGSNKKFKVETYWRDEDELTIKDFEKVTTYDWECFKVVGGKQDFCWRENLDEK